MVPRWSRRLPYGRAADGEPFTTLASVRRALVQGAIQFIEGFGQFLNRSGDPIEGTQALGGRSFGRDLRLETCQSCFDFAGGERVRIILVHRYL